MSCNTLSFIILANLCINNITIAMTKSRSSDSINSQISVVVPGDRYDQETPESRRITYLENKLQQQRQELDRLAQLRQHLQASLQNMQSSIPVSQFTAKNYQSITQELDTFKRRELFRFCPESLRDNLSMLAYEGIGSVKGEFWLFYGQTGNGKSCLAKLTAYLAKKPYFFLGPLDLIGGRGLAINQIDELFIPLIKNQTPSVVILDELSGFIENCKSKNSGNSAGISHLGMTLDDCRNSNVLVIATINEKEDVPASLLDRASKFHIFSPSLKSRLRILKHNLSNNNVSEEFLRQIAQESVGFTLRDLENLIIEARDNMHEERIEQPRINHSPQSTISEKNIQDAFTFVYNRHLELHPIDDSLITIFYQMIKKHLLVI